MVNKLLVIVAVLVLIGVVATVLVVNSLMSCATYGEHVMTGINPIYNVRHCCTGLVPIAPEGFTGGGVCAYPGCIMLDGTGEWTIHCPL